MSAAPGDSWTASQGEARDAIHAIARASDGALTIDLDCRQLAGYLIVRIYLASASLASLSSEAVATSSGQAIQLRDWEPIDILIPKNFPYKPPIAWAGRQDFPDLPHQAKGSGFCVRVEDNNWDRAAGMPGFLRAVIDTYQRMALGGLQGHLQPWRPTSGTVGYRGEGWAVIRADLPLPDHFEPEAWRRWAIGIPVTDNRIDIVEWLNSVDDDATAAGVTEALSGELARIRGNVPGAFLVPAITLAQPVAVEYCSFWLRLLDRLEEQGVDSAAVLDHLAQASAINQSSGGEEHAAVLFRVAADTGSTTEGQDARFAVARLPRRNVELLIGFTGDQAAQVTTAALTEFVNVEVSWIQVYDGRPESVLRRTAGRPTEKLAGAKVLLLGCGGLGAPIAEHCVRSGAARLHIVDEGTVSPGVLSRQPYEDADIGKAKAEVLASRLGRIRPESKITTSVDNILDADLFRGPDLGRYDFIIDATANRSVAAKIERAQRDLHDGWPTLITVAINQEATHGVAAVTPQGTVGASVDLLRQLGLRACGSTALSDVYTAFFPPEAGRLNFRPDATCSDTTFVGSSTDMSALAAQLLHSALAQLDLRTGATGDGVPNRSLGIVRLGRDAAFKPALVVLDLPPDHVIIDQTQTYEVRVDENALATIRDHVRASVNGRIGGAGLTGGLLLGEFDGACRVAWVSQATGLPPGSTATPLAVNWDGNEVRNFLEDRVSESEARLALVGFWRTHTGGAAVPSPTDAATMRQTVASREWGMTPALLLELAVPEDQSKGEPGAQWLPEVHAETFVAGADPLLAGNRPGALEGLQQSGHEVVGHIGAEAHIVLTVDA
jgi:hypothetical protein